MCFILIQQRIHIHIGKHAANISLFDFSCAAVIDIIGLTGCKEVCQLILRRIYSAKSSCIGVDLSVSHIIQGITYIGGLHGPVLLVLLISSHILLQLFQRILNLSYQHIVFLIVLVCIFLNTSKEQRLISLIQHFIGDDGTFQAPLVKVSQPVAKPIAFFALRHVVIDSSIFHIILNTDDAVRIVCSVLLKTAASGCCLQYALHTLGCCLLIFSGLEIGFSLQYILHGLHSITGILHGKITGCQYPSCDHGNCYCDHQNN